MLAQEHNSIIERKKQHTEKIIMYFPQKTRRQAGRLPFSARCFIIVRILPEFFFHFGYDTALYTRNLHLRHADHLGDFALRHVAEVP